MLRLAVLRLPAAVVRPLAVLRLPAAVVRPLAVLLLLVDPRPVVAHPLQLLPRPVAE